VLSEFVALAAVDCEMVSTVNGLELGRLSLIGPNMEAKRKLCFFLFLL
jgi:hypothetical protein